MIELLKGPTPHWIVANQAAKTLEYQQASQGSKPNPWREEEVVAALKHECRNKCMYCEGVVDDVAYSAVEHIRPKSKFPDRVLQWDNLGLACTRCNTNKGEYWSDQTGNVLLNPYSDKVSEHLAFIGAVVASKDGSSRGSNTIRKLKFAERDDLFISKARRIQEVEARIILWLTSSDPEMKELLAEDIRDAIGESREFSASLSSYAVHRGFDIRPKQG